MGFLSTLNTVTAAAPRPSMLSRLGAITDRAVDPREQIYTKGRWGRDGVTESEDLERILAIPRRARPTFAEQQRMADEMTRRLERPGVTSCKCAELRPNERTPCITRLLPIQGWYLHEAARALGAIGHITAGRGKCLARGSEIYDLATGRRLDISEALGDLIVPSLRGGVLSAAAAEGFPSGSKPCWRVELADGAKLDASFDHPILTSSGWVEAAQLQRGDLVAVARRAPAPETLTEATADEVSLIALLMADGSLNGGMAGFTNATPAVITEFQRTASAVCEGWSEELSKSAARQFDVLGSRELREKWNLYGLAKDKRLHPSLWGLSREHVALFLNRFWACDGSVLNNRLEISLASEKLIDDLRFLLLRLGVHCRKRERSVTCGGDRFRAWALAIHGQDAVTFLREVGPVLGKEAACTALQLWLDNTKRNTNTDVVPVGPRELVEIFDEMGWPGKVKGGPRGSGQRGEARTFLGGSNGYVSRERFAAFCERFGYRGKYASLVIDGIGWERVEHLTPLGTLPVFDLTVPGPHNFVANGIVVHNTGIDIELPLVVPDCRRAVLMIPPNLRRQFATDYLIWKQHFRVPNLTGGTVAIPGLPVLDVIAYSELSSQGWATWLKTSGADILIGDEAQNLKDKNSARTDRFLRFYIDVEEEVEAGRAPRVPYFFAHSGTLTEASCDEYGHLSALALREQSPLPIDTGTLGQWCEALDPGPGGSPRRAIGAMSKLCTVGETVRTGFRRRLIETLGVITTEDAELSCKLKMHERRVIVPPVIKNSIAFVKSDRRRPDGQLLEELSEIAAVCKQLAAGFFYIWRYPRGEPEELIDLWLMRRSSWAREVRERLEHRTDLLDTPGLLETAAQRALGLDTTPGPTWQAQTYSAWLEVKDLVQPVTDTVWIDEFLARDGAAWAREAPGVVWYGHDSYGQKVSELAGAPLYASGDEEPKRLNPTTVMLERRAAFQAAGNWEGGDVADNWLKCEDGSRSIVASIKAHGTGKNMQAWRRALVSNPPVKGWEQLLARLHRQGQTAESIDVFVYRHTADVRDAFEKARCNAQFVFETTGRNERLLFAEYSFDPGTARALQPEAP